MKISKDYFGTEVYCPCCDTQFSRFCKWRADWSRHNKDFYEGMREDVICPKCGSLPRHRITCDWLEKHKNEMAFDNVILFAPNFGIETWFKRNRIYFRTADLFDRKAHLTIDIQDIPFPDDSISFISSDSVLECELDYKLALREMYRVLKAGGAGICEVTVPLLPGLDSTYEEKGTLSPDECMRHYGWIDARRLFGMDFASILHETGFDVHLHDGDNCDKLIVPVTGPSKFDYNKVFICKKA